MGLCGSTKSKEIPEGDMRAYDQNKKEDLQEKKTVQNDNGDQKQNTNQNNIQVNKEVKIHPALNYNQQKAYPRGKASLLRKIQGDEKDRSQDNLKKKVEVYVMLNKLPVEGKMYDCELIVHEEGVNTLKIAKLSPQEARNGSITFADCVEMNYYFEREQTLEILVREIATKTEYSIKESIGKIASSIKNNSRIVCPNSKIEVELDIKPIKSERKHYNFNFNISSNDGKQGSQELYLIFKNFNDNKNWRGVYKSEESKTSQFEQIVLSEDDLFLGDPNKTFIIELHSTSSPFLLGYIEDNISRFIQNNSVQLRGLNNELINYNLNFKVSSYEVFSFVELLKKGLQISLMVAVDFTASNLQPSDPKSLHYVSGGEPNQYERAMRACGNIIANYDNDKMFPLIGFGGIPEGKSEEEHVFPLNYQLNPNVNGIDEMIKVYKESLKKTQLSGPTYFSPLLRNLKKLIQDVKGVYFTIMILTDGQINDIEETVDAIIECSFYPVSIIIIGIGSADFNNMERLDGDDMPLTDSQGRSIARDIVQFVPYRKYEGNTKKLAEELLRELPSQVEKFYVQKSI